MVGNIRDTDRVGRIQTALKQGQLDAVVCALPACVLMSTGYWPVVGTSIAVTNADGRQIVLAPRDEQELARRGWAEVRTYEPASINNLGSVGEAVTAPMALALSELGVSSGRIGFERGPASEPASYVAMYLFGASMVTVIHTAAPQALLLPADDLLATLAADKTRAEVDKIRIACQIAERAFQEAAPALTVGTREIETAAEFRKPLATVGTGYKGVARADGFVSCMSGANSAEAQRAYARSRERVIEFGDFALVHCNSYADGYWTDITRTYCVGDPDDRQLAMYEAVLAARNAALKTIRPGIAAQDVDHAAREKLERRGFADNFTHSTGHGVGFAAIYANARPRIHPRSDDVLQPGMVFNVEPAVYIQGLGGVRHCDMVAVTDSGVEVLTPFHSNLDELIITGEQLLKRKFPERVA
jgi:Xaa-Pro aminopeptidase